MENVKTYKEYYIKNKTWGNKNKIDSIKKIMAMSFEEFESLEDWQTWRLKEHLTNKQVELFNNKDLKGLKELLKKQLVKEKIKMQESKEKALAEYNELKKLIDIKGATFEIVWSKNRGTYGYQCKCIARVQYKNNTSRYFESEYTGGCGYDKQSSALSYALNEVAKIMLVKNGNKIINDERKHNNFYACEPLYFQYGVGISSYETMFRNMGYKTRVYYTSNEDCIIDIEK